MVINSKLDLSGSSASPLSTDQHTRGQIKVIEVLTEQQKNDENLLKISSIAYRLSDNTENKKQLAADILRIYSKLTAEQVRRLDDNNLEIRQLVCQLIEEKNKSEIKPAEKPKPDARQLSLYSECEFYFLLARQSFDCDCTDQNENFTSALKKFTALYSQLNEQQLQTFTAKHLEQKCTALNTQMNEADTESDSELKLQYKALVFDRMNNLKLFLHRLAEANPDSAGRFESIANQLRFESEPVM